MSKSQKILLTIILSLLLSINTAFALTFKNLVTFGDSLTDSGNNFTLEPGFYNTDNYSGGAYSNGKIWAEYLAHKLGITNTYLLAQFIGSGSWNPPEGNVWYNSAFGGAETGTGQIPPGLLTQVGVWVTAGIKIPDNSLCIIWIGGNNFLNWISDHSLTQDDYAEVTEAAVGDIMQALFLMTDTEAGLAATDILIMNLPNLGKTPSNNGYFGNNNTDYGTLVSSTFNSKLNNSINTFQESHPSINLYMADAYFFLEKAVENPQQFGFMNAESPALYETKPEYGFDNVGKYLFWDGVHPTTEAHETIANQVYGGLLFENTTNDIFFFESHLNDTIGLEYDAQDFRFVPMSPNDYTPPNDTNKPDFIYGLFDFTITLDNNETYAEFTVYLPDAAPSEAKWYKSTSDGWIDFDRQIINDPNNDGAVFSEDRTKVTLHITDNGPYDEDDSLGVIKDPSGLGSDTSSAPVSDSESNSDSSSGCFILTVFGGIK
jgi:phospholipase/lecithinase/hemolysin